MLYWDTGEMFFLPKFSQLKHCMDLGWLVMVCCNGSWAELGLINSWCSCSHCCMNTVKKLHHWTQFKSEQNRRVRVRVISTFSFCCAGKWQYFFGVGNNSSSLYYVSPVQLGVNSRDTEMCTSTYKNSKAIRLQPSEILNPLGPHANWFPATPLLSCAPRPRATRNTFCKSSMSETKMSQK